MRSSDFVNHLYDYRPNWTPLSPVTIIYCCHDVTSMKVTSMKYEKFNIQFFCVLSELIGFVITDVCYLVK